MKRLAVTLFVLPDGRYVFQRRTKDAPVNAGLLGFFGGHVEDGESFDEAVRRETKEETSLDVDKLNFVFRETFTVEREGERAEYCLYEVAVSNINFKVYEGVRAEAYSLDEVIARSDLTSSVKYVVEKLKGVKHV